MLSLRVKIIINRQFSRINAKKIQLASKNRRIGFVFEQKVR